MSAEWQTWGYSWESAWVLPYVPEACLLFSFFFLADMLSCPEKCMMQLGVCEGNPFLRSHCWLDQPQSVARCRTSGPLVEDRDFSRRTWTS